jgi:hypothetical protein
MYSIPYHASIYGSDLSGNFIVELYSAKQSPYWLSPSYGYIVLRVDLYWWNKNMGLIHLPQCSYLVTIPNILSG